MSALGDIFKQHNIDESALKNLVAELKTNPMAAMGLLQGLNLPPEVMQQLMGIVMMNPTAIDEFAAELGVSQEDIDELKNNFKTDSPQ